MKTKIIYISGAEQFNIADVRAAFEEVRTAIALSDDTVLFGVPVDADDSLDNKFEEVIPTDANNIESDAPVEKPIAAKPKRGRKATTNTNQPVSEPAEPVIPILSVLGSDTPSLEETQPEENTDSETPPATITISEASVEITETDTPEIPAESTETIQVDEIIVNDIPNESEPAVEKTLEELLESMEPLREDEEPEHPQESESVDLDTDNIDATEDATLQQLATEFIENQHKISATPKSNTRSKIGKLKNILPFKKAKHDEGGIMGDLFGWAGVAANDDDFTVPGFLDLSNTNK
ncbi:MAG: hypothetical protein KBS86_01275 [Proteobacteria bacterium]|nr:hypothetical protein [Candidatus Enterousia scatequi]